MHRARFASCWLVLVALLVPGPADASVGQLRMPTTVLFDEYGNFSPAPGIECLGVDPPFLLGYGVYSLVSGMRIATLLSPLNGGTYVTRQVRDLDGDGIDEVFGSFTPGGNPVFSLQRLAASGTAMEYVFPNFTSLLVSTLVGTMNLNAGEPHALVMKGPSAILIKSYGGQTLYDSSQDIKFPIGGVLFADIGDFDGDGFDEVHVSINTGGSDPNDLLIGDPMPTLGVTDPPSAMRAQLFPSRPNPARGDARIEFATPTSARVRLRIYDAAGRLVSQLADEKFDPGRHTRLWNGRDLSGQQVRSGMYFYELEVDGLKQSRKLIELH